MKILMIALTGALLLSGCGMSDAEISASSEKCSDLGKEPVLMVTLDGRVDSVRCW